MAFMDQTISISNIEWSTNGENIPKLSRWWLRKQESLINILNFQNAFVIVVQPLSCVWLFATPWNAAYSLSFTVSRILLKLMFIESVMPYNHLILCHLLFLLPSIFPSIRVFPNESILHIRWPKYWCFSINPANEYSGLISFRIDWFDLLAVHETLKSPRAQFKSINSSVLSLLYSPTLTSIHN